jgi:hypothetical protein
VEGSDSKSCPVDYSGIRHGGKLTDEERRRLEEKLSRLLEWVGAWVPDEMVLDGKKVPLHNVVWSIIKKDRLGDDDLKLLLSLEKKLSAKFRVDMDKIRYEDSMEDEAVKDYCEAIGLLRAIVTLKDIEKREEKDKDRDELIERMRNNTKDQARYWLDFLKALQ